MRLLRRLTFALRFDFDPEFIVYSIPDQSAMYFSDYKQAKKYSDSQIQYRPKVMVAVRRAR